MQDDNQNNNITKTKIESAEYEVLAEAHIVGSVQYDDFSFMIWEFGNKPQGEKRKLCLRITDHTQPINNDSLNQLAEKATKNGKYTNLGRDRIGSSLDYIQVMSYVT